MGELGNRVTCGITPFEPFDTTVSIKFALAVIMALEFTKFLDESREYGGGAGVAAGFAVFGVGSPTFGFLKYGFP